jgi:hypothetical protein
MKSGTSAIGGVTDVVRTNARDQVTLAMAMQLESDLASVLWID